MGVSPCSSDPHGHPRPLVRAPLCAPTLAAVEAIAATATHTATANSVTTNTATANTATTNTATTRAAERRPWGAIAVKSSLSETLRVHMALLAANRPVAGRIHSS